MTEAELSEQWDDIPAEKKKAMLKLADNYLWWSGLFERLGVGGKFLIVISGGLTAYAAVKSFFFGV